MANFLYGSGQKSDEDDHIGELRRLAKHPLKVLNEQIRELKKSPLTVILASQFGKGNLEIKEVCTATF